MTYAVLDPSILHISEEDWINNITRDSYLEHFLEMLDGIQDNKIALAWSEEFDEYFWEAPQKLPWNMDKCWSNSMIPVIYTRINKNAFLFDLSNKNINCEIMPDIIYSRNDFYLLFLGLISELHTHCEKIAMCFGLKNIPPSDHRFLVNGEQLTPEPVFITQPNDFLNLIDISESFWPTSSDDDQSLKDGISKLLIRDYGREKPICAFTFSKAFISKLYDTTDDREKILDAITKRLTMTKAEAGRSGSLLDEDVKGKKGLRRFRVTSAKRVHYTEKSGKIEFLMFYDEGEHDDGL